MTGFIHFIPPNYRALHSIVWYLEWPQNDTFGDGLYSFYTFINSQIIGLYTQVHGILNGLITIPLVTGFIHFIPSNYWFLHLSEWYFEWPQNDTFSDGPYSFYSFKLSGFTLKCVVFGIASEQYPW